MNTPPRLALFTDTFDETNGVAHTYRLLAEYSEKSGLPLDVYAPGETADRQDEGKSTRIFRFRRRLSVEYYDDLHFSLLPNFHVRKVFQSQPKYDLVHLATPGNLGSWGRRLARAHRRPMVGVHHTQLQDYAALRSPKVFSGMVRNGALQILRWFYSPCGTILTPTPKVGEIIQKLGIARRTEVFGRGVDTRRFSPEHRSQEKSEACRLLYVGRLAVEKNLGALARVLNRLKQTNGIEMTFVGDGPMSEELKSRLPWASFPGIKRGPELSECYANADLFLFPSLTDTFGNVVNEALASGVPCVVMDSRGPGEVIEPGVTGLLGETEDDFATEAESLIRNRDRREKMGRAARGQAEKRDWDQVFSSLWSFYERASTAE